MSDNKDKLNAKHEAFCHEYLKTMNANEAYKKVYKCKQSTADTNGPELLRKTQVKNRIAQLQQKTFDKYEIDRGRILKEMETMALVNIAEAFNDDGSMKKLSEMPEQVQRAIAAIDIEDIYEGFGQDKTYIGDLKKIKLFDKTKTLEMLGRHLKLFTDVVEVKNGDLAARLANARKRAK